MAANNNKTRLQSSVKLVSKHPIQPFSKPVQKPSSRAPLSSKVESLENQLSHFNNTERLTFGLEHFGHLTIEEGGRWTQAEIDAEWEPQYAAKLFNAPTEHCPAFIPNWDFKPAPEPEYIIVNDDPQPVPTSTVLTPTSSAKPFIPSALETPANYWDDWRAREGIVMRHLTPAQYGDE